MELDIASVARSRPLCTWLAWRSRRPAHDWLNTAAVGIASGWAATGVHQSVKQLTKQEQLRQYAGGVRASACCCMCGRVL